MELVVFELTFVQISVLMEECTITVRFAFHPFAGVFGVSVETQTKGEGTFSFVFPVFPFTLICMSEDVFPNSKTVPAVAFFAARMTRLTGSNQKKYQNLKHARYSHCVFSMDSLPFVSAATISLICFS